MNIGIYAGTFDPIHDGHLEFAQAATTQAGLERVIIVAEKEPYRKKPHASWDHRQAMIERATENSELVDHDYQFASQLAHQHTMMDMIAQANKHYGNDNEFWFLVGSDIFEHIGEWKDVVHTQEYGGFVIAMKNDHTKRWLEDKIEKLEASGLKLNTIVVDHDNKRASSSKIRASIAAEIIPENCSSQVLEYCRMHQLYR